MNKGAQVVLVKTKPKKDDLDIKIETIKKIDCLKKLYDGIRWPLFPYLHHNFQS